MASIWPDVVGCKLEAACRRGYLQLLSTDLSRNSRVTLPWIELLPAGSLPTPFIFSGLLRNPSVSGQRCTGGVKTCPPSVRCCAFVSCRSSFGLIGLIGVVGGVSAQVIAPTAPPTPAASAKLRLGEVRSWGYQLQRVDIARVAASPYDLVVVDYSNLGSEAGRFTPADVARLQMRADGSRRIVLAYMSIGEAEDYRYYWRDTWVEPVNILDNPNNQSHSPRAAPAAVERGTVRLRALRLPRLEAPVWLGRENDGWTGNFLVRYWDPGWQRLIFRGSDSYLSRILKAGFDGVYLDRVDAFQAIGRDRPEAQDEMVRMVIAIAEQARRLRPDFLVVPQNGEQLLSDPAYLAAIDGIAKEDLLYGDEHDGQRNRASAVARSMRWLAPAINRGLPVLVVEYVQAKSLVDVLRADIAGRGFVPYFGVRALDQLILPEDLVQATPPLAAVAKGAAAITPPATKPKAGPSASAPGRRTQGGNGRSTVR